MTMLPLERCERFSLNRCCDPVDDCRSAMAIAYTVTNDQSRFLRRQKRVDAYQLARALRHCLYLDLAPLAAPLANS